MTKKLRDHLINCSDEEFAEWIRTASAKHVRFVNLDGVFHSGTKGWIIQQELQARTARHHWTLTPVLIIGFVTMVFAGIAAWPVVHDWIWLVAKKDAQSESVPVPRTQETPIPSVAPTITPSPPTPAQLTPSPSSTPTLARRRSQSGA